MKAKTKPHTKNAEEQMAGIPVHVGGGAAAAPAKAAEELHRSRTEDNSGETERAASKLVIMLVCDETNATVAQVLTVPVSGKTRMILGIDVEKNAGPSPPVGPIGGHPLFIVLECDGKSATILRAARLDVSKQHVKLITVPADDGDPTGGGPAGNTGPIGG